MSLIGGKYKIYIIWRLQDNPMRLGKFYRFFNGVTAHILNRQLKELKADG